MNNERHSSDCEYESNDSPWSICTCGIGCPNNPEVKTMSRAIRNTEVPPSDDYKKGYRHGKQDAAEAWNELYKAINEVVAVIGCHGQIISKDDRVAWLMRCLDIIDGGIFKREPKPAVDALTTGAVEGDWCGGDVAAGTFIMKEGRWTEVHKDTPGAAVLFHQKGWPKPVSEPYSLTLTDEQVATVEEASTKLENIGHIFAGDKQSRRLAKELRALLADRGSEGGV